MAKLIETFLSLIFLLFLQQVVYYLINRNINKVERRHQIRVWTRTLTLLFAFSVIVSLWLPSGQMILQVLALLTAALAVTLGRPISSVLAWFVIVIDNPFGIGDRIEAGDVKGDVIDIGMLHIHILEVGNWVDADQMTGRIIHLPNRTIFEGPVFNSTAEFDLIWNELEFVLTHDSDWERGRELILAQAQPIYERIEEHAMEAADRMTRRYAYQRGITTPYVYVKLCHPSIKLSLRYLCETRRRRGTSHDITVGFLSAIRSEPNIRLAAPTYRILLPEERPSPRPHSALTPPSPPSPLSQHVRGGILPPSPHPSPKVGRGGRGVLSGVGFSIGEIISCRRGFFCRLHRSVYQAAFKFKISYLTQQPSAIIGYLLRR